MNYKRGEKSEIWLLEVNKDAVWDAYLNGRLVNITNEQPFEKRVQMLNRTKNYQWSGYLRKHSKPLTNWDAYRLNRRRENGKEARKRFHEAVEKGKLIKRYSDIVAG